MFALFIPALVGALASAMASFAGRALLALGIGFVSYKGIGVALDAISLNVRSSVGSFTGDTLNLLSYLYVDKALTMIMSAVTIALSMRLLNGGIKRMVHK